MPVAAETKFCTREAEHLREIAHRRLAAVALPVRVRREADGRVERRVRAHGREPLRVQRQHALQALQQIDDDEADEVEEQHGERVALPVALAALVDAGDAIDAALEPAEHRREQRALALVDGRHEHAERLHRGDEQRDVENELQRCLARSFEFLRDRAAPRPGRRAGRARARARRCRARSSARLLR